MDDFVYRFRPWAITLVLHNWPIMLCSAFVLWAAIRAYQWPSRHAVLRLYGGIMLGAAFEYQKHGVPALVSTLSYLVSLETNPEARALSYLILVDILPIELYLLGVVLLAFSLVPGQPRRLRRLPVRMRRAPLARRSRQAS